MGLCAPAAAQAPTRSTGDVANSPLAIVLAAA